MNRIFQRAIAAIMPFGRFAAEKYSPEARVTRISVLVAGRILLDGNDATISDVRSALERARAKRGSVWYYRESDKGEPPPQAIEVFKLIVESKLPISLSTKPNFAEYVDDSGQSRPRE